MNPAEFKTVSESLGLTAQWLADRFQVNLRTVQYWQSGDRASPPDAVCEELLELDRSIDAAVEHAFVAAREFIAESIVKFGEPEEIVLYRFRDEQVLWEHHREMDGLPLTCHGALLARLRRRLRAEGIDVVIDYFEE